MEGRSRTQQLEETITKLQTRIGELESSNSESAIGLREPYDGGDVPFISLELPTPIDQWPDLGPISNSPPGSSRVNTPASSASSSTLVLEEPPPNVIEELVDNFLGKFQQVGFFLHHTTFRQSALQSLPFGHYSRPSPALLSAVYLWGSRLSPTRHDIYNEDAFLVCTLQNIHQDLGGHHPQRVLHGLQAEILLSLYYLTLGRPVEGIYHLSAAVSLTVSAGLHLIRSSQMMLQPIFSVLEPTLPPPATALEEGERIHAFWTVLILNNYWVAAHGSPSAIPYYGTPIDTPWPLELDEYVSLQLFQPVLGAGSGGTIAQFMAGLNVDGFSALALHAKAAILLERSITFSARYPNHAGAETFEALDVVLEQFILSVPLGIGCIGPGLSAPQRSFIITQTLTHTAIIRLHAHRIHTSDVSRAKYLAAARAVVHIMNDANFAQWEHLDPIMGILWKTTCEVFVEELSSMQSYGAVGLLTQQHQEISACFETILDTMRVFTSSCPLIEYFYGRVEEMYRALSCSI